LTEITVRIIAELKTIPYGRVVSYSSVAVAAGFPRAARTVARILHSMSKTENLPWHRVISSNGMISLKPGSGFELQKALLEEEGHKVSATGKVF